jgi:spermidine synthase
MGVPQFLQQIAQIEGSLSLRRLFTGTLLFLGYLPFGAVVPALVVIGIGGSGQAAEQAGRVYSANAFGSVIGAALIGNVLAPRMALDTISALLGVAVFLALIRLPRIGSPDSPVAASKESTVPRALLAVVFGLGFLGLAAELLWFRTLVFFWKGGTQAYSLVVAAYVAGLSVGSGIAGKIAGRWRIGHLGMVSCCYLVGITLLVAAS